MRVLVRIVWIWTIICSQILAMAAAPTRKVWISSGVSVFVAAAIAAFLAGGAPPTNCDMEANGHSAVASALASPANSGKTICVSSDADGTIINVTTQFTSPTRLVAAPNDKTVKMAPMNLNGVENLTIEGFNFNDGGISFSNSNSSTDVAILRNKLHDYEGNGITAFGGITHTRITIRGNYLHCINYPAAGDPSGPTGYGIYTDADSENWSITYNTIEGCGNSSDGMQLANIHNSDVSYNIVRDIAWNGAGSDPHADAVMFWGGSSNITFTNNRVFRSTDTLWSPDSSDISIANNLIVEIEGQCVDATENGSSGPISPLRFNFTHNTIWQCGNGGINMNRPTGARGQNVASQNVVEQVLCNSPSVWQVQDSNNYVGGDKTCWPGASNTEHFVPDWEQTGDPEERHYFLVTNAGDAGYQYAPAGYEAPGAAL